MVLQRSLWMFLFQALRLGALLLVHHSLTMHCVLSCQPPEHWDTLLGLLSHRILMMHVALVLMCGQSLQSVSTQYPTLAIEAGDAGREFRNREQLRHI